ncbi:MAG: radical SAM protein [Chitinispirillales bacterium]|jgi:uncharacterized protein|nr:radical SAM protein [Chitinispirillales bacterium]
MDVALLKKYANSLTNEKLRLIILPTEDCNFRCSYCWENFNHGIMSPENVEAIKVLLTNRAKGLKLLEIEWFGGEPLVAKDIVFDISDHIRQLKTEYPQLVYRGAMTTNGYLLNLKTSGRLCESGIKEYRIVLDGTEKFHDATRKLANGGGTFNIIWDNLVALKKSDLDFSIRLNINFLLNNYSQAVPPLLQLINKTFQGDNRFFLFFKAVQRLGGKNDCLIEKVNREEENLIIDELCRLVETQKVIRYVPKNDVCFAAELNTMVIRANGDINKCVIALKDECNNVGKLNTDGTMTIDQQKFLNWSKGFDPLDELYLRCPYKVIKSVSEIQKV